MRYDKRIYFRKYGKKTYDPDSGNYKTASATDTPRIAAVVSMDIQTQKLVYGRLLQGGISVHLQNKYTDSFDVIVYKGKSYRADHVINLRTKQVFLATEVQ